MYREEDCGCGGHGHHGMHGSRYYHGCSCGCGCFGHGHRRFFSKEEIIARLEDYLKELHAEATGVQERIAELRTEEK